MKQHVSEQRSQPAGHLLRRTAGTAEMNDDSGDDDLNLDNSAQSVSDKAILQPVPITRASLSDTIPSATSAPALLHTSDAARADDNKESRESKAALQSMTGAAGGQAGTDDVAASLAAGLASFMADDQSSDVRPLFFARVPVVFAAETRLSSVTPGLGAAAVAASASPRRAPLDTDASTATLSTSVLSERQPNSDSLLDSEGQPRDLEMPKDSLLGSDGQPRVLEMPKAVETQAQLLSAAPDGSRVPSHNPHPLYMSLAVTDAVDVLYAASPRLQLSCWEMSSKQCITLLCF